MNILYTIDDNYSHVLAVSLLSLFENNKQNNLNINILVKYLNSDNEKKLLDIAKKYDRNLNIIKDEKIDDFFKSFGIRKYHGSYSAYYRLIFDRYFEEYDNVLYLDADTIIVNDIKSFQTIDLEENYIAAVKEPQGKHYAKLVDLKDCDYFNSGVMLLNTKKWKKDDCYNKIISALKNKNYYVYPDQDIINIVFKGKIMVLNPKYNYMPIHRMCSEECYNNVFGFNNYYSIDNLIRAKNNPLIIHCYNFLGESPWMKNNNHPDKHLFNYYFKKTTYNDYIPNKPKFNILYFVEKKMFKLLPENIFFKVYKKISIKFLKKRIYNYKKKGLK